MKNFIELRDIHKSFGSQTVHEGITLDIVENAITVIIGPSGTGKSVLLKQMLGLLMPDKGTITVNGVDITKSSKDQLTKIRRQFGMLFQNAALFDSMTVYQNVSFPLREHTDMSEDEM